MFSRRLSRALRLKSLTVRDYYIPDEARRVLEIGPGGEVSGLVGNRTDLESALLEPDPARRSTLPWRRRDRGLLPVDDGSGPISGCC